MKVSSFPHDLHVSIESRGMAIEWLSALKTVGGLLLRRKQGGERATLEGITERVLESNPVEDWRPVVDASRKVVTFTSDLDLRMEIIFSEEGEVHPGQPWQEQWAMNFPDPIARGYFCKLYYGQSLLNEIILVSVDGGRALLPQPIVGGDQGGFKVVSRFDHRVAQIFRSVWRTRRIHAACSPSCG